MARLGSMYVRGAGVAKSEDSGVAWLVLSANARDEWGEWLLGEELLSGRAGKANYAQALALFHQSAIQGNKAALYREGMMYQKGYGTLQNYSKAYSCFIEAANQDYGPAEAAVAAMYDLGFGIQEDKAKAYFWASAASRWGGSEVKERLAILKDEISIDQKKAADEHLSAFIKKLSLQ